MQVFARFDFPTLCIRLHRSGYGRGGSRWAANEADGTIVARGVAMPSSNTLTRVFVTSVLLAPLACSSRSGWREVILAPAPTSPARVGTIVSIRVDDTRFGALGEDCAEGCVGQVVEWQCTQPHEDVNSHVRSVSCERLASCRATIVGEKAVEVTSTEVGTVTIRVVMHDDDDDEDMVSEPLEMTFAREQDLVGADGG